MILIKVGYFGELKEFSLFKLTKEYIDEDKDLILDFLSNGIKIRSFQEYRECVLGCGCAGIEMGCSEVSDGCWVWTDDLAHYVKAHNIDLPLEFINHIKNNSPLSIPNNIEELLRNELLRFEENPRSDSHIAYSDKEWKDWLRNKELTERDPSTIKERRSKSEPTKSDYKLPDSW